jgi:hypothetical protein
MRATHLVVVDRFAAHRRPLLSLASGSQKGATLAAGRWAAAVRAARAPQVARHSGFKAG